MKRMLSVPNVYLYREVVDFSKSINGLAAIIEAETDLPLGTGALFLFTNKQCDKIKVLYWDKTGFSRGISVTTALNAQSNRGLLAEKTGSSPIILMVLMPVRCCTTSSRPQKLTG